MFPFYSRGARLLSPSVQSLYRKAILPTASVRTARSRLYASLQNPPDSGEDKKREPLSEDASKPGLGDHDKKPAPPASANVKEEVELRGKAASCWGLLGHPKNSPEVVEMCWNLANAATALEIAHSALEKFHSCLRKSNLKFDLAYQILQERLGISPDQPMKFEYGRNPELFRVLLRRVAKDAPPTDREVMQLQTELGIDPKEAAMGATKAEGMPDEVHASVRRAWEWLVLEVAAAKKKGVKVKTLTGPASDDGEVQRLTKALGVLKGAMGADKGAAGKTATAKAKAKNKGSTSDSSKADAPGQPTIEAAKKVHVNPLKDLKNLTKSEIEAFRALQGASDKDGPSDTPGSPTVVEKKGKPYSIHYVKANDLELQPIEKPQPPVPGVQYGLDRVLFNPGVYHLQCPRTQVYNFDPYLAKIMPIEEFDFSALKQYVTSSKDHTLINMAASLGKKYTGSTSSMTASLAHFHYLISSWRTITTKSLTKETPVESYNFTRIMRGPAAAFLHYKDGTYAIDADKEFDRSTILSLLGKSMEKLLTLPKEEFENYHRDRSHLLSESAREDPEAFHYTTLGDFLMRSQLDAHNPRLPGTGMFDLKTRAVLSIRMESTNIQNGRGYEIRQRFGEFESFEREYLDMIRSAFLKYSMQVRMGRMDGIFVAYHNTERIFGFQYIPLEEMDYTIHGTTDRQLGDAEFKLSVTLLNKVLDKATARFPGKSLRLHFETRESVTPFMYIFAKPVSEAEINEAQEANKAAVEKFEKEMLGLDPVPEPAWEAEDKVTEDLDLVNEDEEDISSVENPDELGQEMWADMMDRVEAAMEDDARGIAAVREALERALEESGLLVNHSPENSKAQVDAFLSAITSPDLRATAESIQTVGTMEKGVISPDEGAETADKGEAIVAESEPVTLPDSKDTDVDSAAVKETAEFSLKDMILGLAARAQTTTTAMDPPERDSDDYVTPRETMRIRKFERILSEMLSGSKEPGDENAASANIEAKMKQADTISNAKSSESSTADSDTDGGELLGIVLTARNMVNNRLVERVYGKPKDWSLAYSIEEMSDISAKRIYSAVRDRRRKTFDHTSQVDEQVNSRQREFLEKLRRVSLEGMKYRQAQNEKDSKNPVYVLGKEEALDYREVFGDLPKVQKECADDGAGGDTEKTERVADEDVNRGFVDP